MTRTTSGRRARRTVGAGFLFFLGLLGLSACHRASTDLGGVWRGTVTNNSGEQVPFAMEVVRTGNEVSGALLNGEERTPSTSGSFDGKTLELRFDYYDLKLTAAIDGDRLRGTVVRQWQKRILTRPIEAVRGAASAAASPAGADDGFLNGEWVLRVGEGANQRFWRAAFRQQGGQARGTIIPVSGDWGQLTGTWENGVLTLSRFDGINSRVFKATRTPQGTLEGHLDLGLFDPVRKVVAERPERMDAGNKATVALLPDPNNYTRMANPAEPFRFNFPDLDGKPVSNADERFRGKALIVTVTGSWCPNCYDEAPILQELYDRYKSQGLEVVALGFEYTGDRPRDAEQLRIFARRLKLTFPVLLAGSTEEGDAQRKLPQLVNFGAYPTTLYIGRDGRVRQIHTGFEGRATGERFAQLKGEMETTVKELLELGGPPSGGRP